MKQRITRKDLEQLTEDQKRSLSNFWSPAVYDVAAARVLKNVATDEYDEYEFVVGGISVHGTTVYLTDMIAGIINNEGNSKETADPEEADAETDYPALDVKVDPLFGESYPGFGASNLFGSSDNSADESAEEEYDEEGYDEDFEEEEPGDVFNEEDLENNYQRPATLIKTDCLPLLTIGNMIEILQKNNFGRFDFFLTASTLNIGCELGRGEPSWGGNNDWEPAELCDVLWESIRELL